MSLPNGTALSMPNGPVLSPPNGPALSLPNGPALSLPNGPALSLPNGPALSLPNGPAEWTCPEPAEWVAPGPTNARAIISDTGYDIRNDFFRGRFPRSFKNRTRLPVSRFGAGLGSIEANRQLSRTFPAAENEWCNRRRSFYR